MTMLCHLKSLLTISALLVVLLLAACSILNILPPEVNRRRVDVQDVTVSHVNLLPDKTDVAFSMQGSVRVSAGSMFPKRFSFVKEVVIPF